jgi:uncharacterized integral membrane protein
MIRVLLLLPFLLLLVAFAISNPQPVTLAMWPTDVTLDAPLSIAVLVVAGAFFLLGALVVWLPGLATRARARNAERRVTKLEAELAQRTNPNPNPKVPLLAAPR